MDKNHTEIPKVCVNICAACQGNWIQQLWKQRECEAWECSLG